MAPKTKPKPIPDTYRRVPPCLIVLGGGKALEFYGKAFDATERMRFSRPPTGRSHRGEAKRYGSRVACRKVGPGRRSRLE